MNPVILETNSLTVDAGGTGGTGGVSGNIEVLSTGTIMTQGENAHGIYAQSTGGGGGTGGLAALFTFGIGGAAANGANNFGVNVGGTGGAGAASGTVHVENDGTIITHGGNAAGLLAESVAGGGGDGGMVINGALFGEGRTSQGSLNIGGHGGDGAQANTVTVDNFGSIHTTGEKAPGIQAQSIGDGGGNGGLVVNFDLPIGANDGGSGSGAINVGGFGGTGGAAGTAIVTNHTDASIVTTGKDSYGIFAQSVGGGGGNGGGAVSLMRNGSAGEGGQTYSGSLTVGGWGGTGGTGAGATVTNDGIIDTAGEGAHGIFAQSVSDGGGNGGFALALNGAQGDSPPTFSTLAVAVGGGGGDGADAGAVVVENSGTIITRGDHADGIFAQSVGGSGGSANVGLSGSGSSLVTSGIVNVLSGALGASGLLAGSGASGSTVEVNHSGNITVLGLGSEGIKAQSVNGGGGGFVLDLNSVTTLPGAEGLPGVPAGSDPGFEVPILTLRAGGDTQTNTSADVVTVNDTGTYNVAATNGAGIGVQSIGGGGGTSLVNMSFAEIADARPMDVTGQLGGEEVNDATGGEINQQHKGDIVTTGVHALASYIQSIGGGGGRDLVHIEPHMNSLGNVNFSLGAVASQGNHGGDVTQTIEGNSFTIADNGIGFLVQSIGAGGGEVHISGANSASINMGGQNDSNGNGGAINFLLQGNLTTTGERSHGLILQSIGGGGGAVFADSQTVITANLFNTNSGNGGDIDFQLDGDINVRGSESIGLLVQSLGGGGGYIDGVGVVSAGGSGAGGNLNLDLHGSIYSDQNTAVLLQSQGSEGSGNITLTLSADKMIANAGDVPALILIGQSESHLTNHGSVASMFESGGIAIQGASSNDLIDNFGVVFGSVDLGDGVNTLVNHTAGQAITGAIIDLGASANFFNNMGVLAPGGMGAVQHTDLNGRYIQESGAIAQMDIDFAIDQADALHASGTADIAGSMDLSLVNTHAIKPGIQNNTLFSADSGITDNGLSLKAPSSVVIDYDLNQINENDIALSLDVDFAAHGKLGQNRSAFGNYLNRVQEAGSSESLENLITALVNEDNIDDYDNMLIQLSPDFYAAQQTNTLLIAQQFGRSLMSCYSQDLDLRFVRQGSCIWIRLDNSKTEIEAVDGIPDMDFKGFRQEIGGQLTRNNLTLGLGFSLEDIDSDGFSNFWTGSSDTKQVGGVIKYQINDILLSSMLSYGKTDSFISRSLNIFGPAASTTKQKLEFYDLMLQFEYNLLLPYINIKPLFELGGIHLRSKTGSEESLGALGLYFANTSENYVWFRPGFELSHGFDINSEAALRPYLRASMIHYFERENTKVRAGLIGAPAGVEMMSINSSIGQNQYLLEAGLDYVFLSGITLQLRYEHTFADNFSNKQAVVKLSFPLK